MSQGSEMRAAEQVIQWLREATSQIGRDYFELPIDGAPDRVFRERVYCYELYHQLRIVMPDEFPYSLGGEVDKRAHPLMRADGVRDTIPDLLVHQPGHMEGNLIITEVKPTRNRSKDIQDDLAKISRFIETAGYVKGVMLLFGPDESTVRDVAQAASGPTESRDRISLLWHRAAGEQARQMDWAA